MANSFLWFSNDRHVSKFVAQKAYTGCTFIGMEGGRNHHPDCSVLAGQPQHPFRKHAREVELASHDRS